MDKTYIGVDLGGTSLKLEEIDHAGNVLRRGSVPSGYLTQREALSLIEKELEAFLVRPAGEPAAIGAGLLGGSTARGAYGSSWTMSGGRSCPSRRRSPGASGCPAL